jgi:GT2 family glycosyltransferase
MGAMGHSEGRLDGTMEVAVAAETVAAAGPLYSIVIISFRRDDALQENLADLAAKLRGRDDVELMLVDNNEDDADRATFLTGFRRSVYYKPGVNRGVAGGRNDGVTRSSGAILVFLDDDAFISPHDFVDRIGTIFTAEPGVGILAFRSFNYYTRKMERMEFPHTNKSLDPAKPFKTFRYIGVAHAIRREVFERAGLYDDDFFYGMEEFDLAYRAVKAAYEIRYSPEIEVLHKKNPKGRLPASQVVERMLLNKMRVNFMHLPSPYAYVSATLWNAYAIWWSRGRANLPAVWRRYTQWTRANPHKRRPISGSALAYFRACGAQLWK